jgi:hypothetical protein
MRNGVRAVVLTLAATAVTVSGCDYVVLPPDDRDGGSGSSKGWTAVATAIGAAPSGGLEVSLTIRNETGAWSAMHAASDRAAILTGADGKTTECTTVVVGSGGHRLAPGMHMRGFTSGSPSEPKTEPIRVGCAGIEAPAPGSRLAIDYSYVTGEYNYYEPNANRVDARLEVHLDPLVSDLSYPIAEQVDGVVVQPDVSITAINGVVLTLTSVERSATTLTSTWKTTNPGAYPSFVHIGHPPVIGSDGVLYGVYESPDLTSVPVTPAGGEMEWTTEVEVPAEVTGLYMMLSVESKKQRLFVNYAIDLGDV